MHILKFLSISQVLQVVGLSFILIHCLATLDTNFKFPSRTTNKTCLIVIEIDRKGSGAKCSEMLYRVDVKHCSRTVTETEKNRGFRK